MVKALETLGFSILVFSHKVAKCKRTSFFQLSVCRRLTLMTSRAVEDRNTWTFTYVSVFGRLFGLCTEAGKIEKRFKL